MADPNFPTPSLLEQLRARVRRIKHHPTAASLVPAPTGPHDDIYQEGVLALDEMAQDPGEWAGCDVLGIPDIPSSSSILPCVIPNISPVEYVAILLWALLYAAGGTMTRTNLAGAVALRKNPERLKRLAPASMAHQVNHWRSIVGAHSLGDANSIAVINALLARRGVSMETNHEGRSAVSVTEHTPGFAQIDTWFHFEAGLLWTVLRAATLAEGVEEAE